MIGEGEEEKFWRHPVHPIRCNQIGLLYVDEDYDVKYQDGRKEVVAYRHSERQKGDYDWIEAGHPLRVMFECWAGRQVKYSAFVFADGNPLNTTQENLVRKGEVNLQKWKDAYCATADFRTRSLEYMRKKDEILHKRGVDPVNYWSSFGLPIWLKQMYFKGNVTEVKGVRGPYIHKSESLELMVKILDLRESGRSHREIQEILNLSHINRVKYWLKKAERINDI